MKRNEIYMNNINIFVVLSIVAAASLFVGTMASSVLAVSHDNMTMSMDNSTMPMDHSNMTMTMDNSTTGTTDDATIAVN